jgi:phage-related protein
VNLDKVDQNRYILAMTAARKKIVVEFFQNDNGAVPVREWLLGLSVEDRKTIGEDIKTVEFGWPIGMPTAKALGGGLYEVRSTISGGVNARVLFTIYKSSMVLLHGFIKKTQKTRTNDLRIARRRKGKFS